MNMTNCRIFENIAGGTSMPAMTVNKQPKSVSHFMYYNFVQIHKTLRVTPAMEAGLTKKFWTIGGLAKLIDRL